MAHSQTFFANAQNVTLNDVHITTTSTTHDFVSTTLHQQIASAAILNSAERYSSAKCHPGTRKKFIAWITEWITNLDPTQHILWLHGPPGAGKSALAQTICELLLESHPAQYGGSFFFARGSTDRGKSLKLFTTLSYQLAIQFPSMRSEINKALYSDPSLPTKSMEIQLLSLIVQPLLACPTLSSPDPILIIDGLDECADDSGLDTQGQIVTMISKAVFEYNLPLRFFIASRPEVWIRDAFEASPLPDNARTCLSLRPDEDTSEDIRAYLRHEFEKIRVANKRIMGSVELPWPPPDMVNHFVYKAEGQFIYAATILKFVDKHSRFNNPQEQLRIITSSGPNCTIGFSELDRLYATILATYPRWETMRRVLRGLIAHVRATTIEVVYH